MSKTMVITGIANPKVCISVLNWNNPLMTIQCIHALQRSDYPNYEIFITDNASSDKSVEQFRREFPEIRIICAPENLGYAGGNQLALNVALSKGSFDLFWILNNDAIVRPDTLSELIRAYRRYGDALFGGIPVHKIKGEYYLHMRVWENRKRRVLRNVPVSEHYEVIEPRFVEALSGSHLLVPLSIVRRYGFMDTSFFLYGEDTDYCFRLQQNKVTCIEVPASVVIHYDGASHKTTNVDRLTAIIRYYSVRNRIVLSRRHFGVTRFVQEIFRQMFYAIGWLLMAVRHGPLAFLVAYYSLLGIKDAILNRMGKTYDPEVARDRQCR